VTSDYGEVTSANSMVTINPETAIITHPVSKEELADGSSITFSVVATGADLTYSWSKDGVELMDNNNISGSSTEVLSIANVNVAYEGEYECLVTGLCSEITSNKAILTIKNTTSINDLTDMGVSIFPNPSNGIITIQFDSEIDEAVVVIYDLVGRILYHKNIITNSFMIDISDKAKGVYILKIEIENKLITSKLIVE
jgi:hypothetical protein